MTTSQSQEPTDLIKTTKPKDGEPGTMTLSKTCRQCKVEQKYIVRTKDYVDWRTGKLIQDAFPYLDIAEREILISSTCGPCFDKLFPPEEG